LAKYGVMGVAAAADWFDRRVVDGFVNAVGRSGVAIATASDWFDRRVVDGTVNAFSLTTVRSSLSARRRQTGRVQDYTAVIVFGLSIIILLILIWRVVLPALGVP